MPALGLYFVRYREGSLEIDDCLTIAKKAIGTKKRDMITMPEGMVFLNRLQFGFYSVLARFDVEVDYAAVERDAFAAADAREG